MLGIYCRISREKELGKGESLDDQKNHGIELAGKLGIEYKVYTDDGISGAGDKIADRPEFEKFLGDVANGNLTHVYAYDQSRFERNPEIRFVITKLFKENNVVYYTHLDGIVDLHDPQMEFFGDLLSVINKYQVTTTKIKVRSSLRNRAIKGKGQAVMPFGYTKDADGKIIIDDEEAEIVKYIFAQSLKGIGTNKIAEKLNEQGILTRYNKLGTGSISTENKYTKEVTTKLKTDVKWAGNTIRNIIINPVSKGQKRFRDLLIEVPPIFEEKYWDAVNTNLPKNMNVRTSTKTEHAYLLKGLLRCGKCGRNMYGRKRLDKHDNHYMCSSKRIKSENCQSRSINIDKLDAFIWKKLFVKKGFLSHLHKQLDSNNNEAGILEIENKISILNKKIEAYKIENSRAVDLVLKKIISEQHLTDAIEKNDSQILKCENEILNLKESLKLNKNTVHLIDKYRQMFVNIKDNDSFEIRSKIINDFIKNIIVKYDEVDKLYLIEIEYLVSIENESFKTDVISQSGKLLSKYAKKVEGSNIFNTIVLPQNESRNV